MTHVFVLFESVDSEKPQPLAAYSSLEKAKSALDNPNVTWSVTGDDVVWHRRVESGVSYDYTIYQVNVDPSSPHTA